QDPCHLLATVDVDPGNKRELPNAVVVARKAAEAAWLGSNDPAVRPERDRESQPIGRENRLDVALGQEREQRTEVLFSGSAAPLRTSLDVPADVHGQDNGESKRPCDPGRRGRQRPRPTEP